MVAVEEIGTASAPIRTVRVDVFWGGEVKRQLDFRSQYK